jgi:hypothetical protein
MSKKTSNQTNEYKHIRFIVFFYEQVPWFSPNGTVLKDKRLRMRDAKDDWFYSFSLSDFSIKTVKNLFFVPSSSSWIASVLHGDIAKRFPNQKVKSILVEDSQGITLFKFDIFEYACCLLERLSDFVKSEPSTINLLRNLYASLSIGDKISIADSSAFQELLAKYLVRYHKPTFLFITEKER